MDVMSMKGSRRKQSMPIRVSHNDDSEMPVPPPNGDEEFVNGDNFDASDPEHEKENEMHISNIAAAVEHQFDHLKNINRGLNESSPLNFARDNGFPTAYHRLGSEFFKNSSNFVPNGHVTNAMDGENNIDKNGNDVVDGEFDEKNEGEKTKDMSGIFHPDAYCDLCDKEFCNKYFLKTHKANKHGIYDNSLSSSPFSMNGNPLPPSLVLPQDYSNLPYKLNLDYPLPPFKPNTSMSSLQKPPTPQLTPPTNLPAMSPLRSASPPTTQHLSQTPNKPPQSPLPLVKPKPTLDLSMTTNTSSLSSSSSENGEKKAPGTPVNQDMEDFCEICQKHFCNKYYLKKHKNDVHGITPPDTPLSTGKRGGRPPNSELKLPASVSSDSPLIPHSLANFPGMPNMPGVMVLNPFLPPMLIPTGSLMNQHGHMPPRPPHLPMSMSSPLPFSTSSPMPPIMSMGNSMSAESKSLPSPGSSITSTTSPSPKSALTVETLRNMGIPVPDGASPNEALRRMGLLSPDGQIASEALRGMGILNAEAFCDICRKEFCNKYFLNIHKANKHGVFSEDPFMPPSMAAAMGMNMPPMPKPSDLPTRTSESSTPSNGKDREKDNYDNVIVKSESSPKAATTPVSQPSDFMMHCNLCSNEFASKYAYRIHRIQAHGMINETFNEAELAEEAFRLHNGDLPKYVSNKITEEISAMERNAEASGFSTMFGSMVAAKLADRVTCEICNKELCNKYFLKAHKLKVHGIDMDLKSPRPGTAMLPNERAQARQDFSPAAASHLDFSNIARSFNLKPDYKSESKEPSSHSRPQSTASMGASMGASIGASMDNPQNNGPVERPSNDALVKLGMDPEAYCEICKKEFCSKYFLRTHKQNIHGIPPKTESNEPTHSRSLSMAPHLALSTPLLPSSFMGSSFMGSPFMNSTAMTAMTSSALGSSGHAGLPSTSLSSLPMSLNSQMKPMNLSASNGTTFDSKAKEGSGSTTPSWKWKEPINASRVTCDLCNKEVCNKYFLRTHKIKKHGILPEDLSPCPSIGMSPNTSDMETSSNSSIPTDMSFEKNMNGPKLNLENSKLFTNRMDDGPANFHEALNLKIKSENERYYNNYQTEICHLCDRKFKSSKWLRQHILKDHAGLTALSPTMDRAFNVGGRYAPLDLRTCSVCSIVFPSEMSMQLHMIQEHNAQVTIKTDPQSPTGSTGESRGPFSGTAKKFGLKPRFTFSLKQKFYSCSVCNHKSQWLSKILSHERKVHRINHNLKKFSCKSCRKVFRKEKAYQNHMMQCHGDYSLTVSQCKKYRCTTCDRSFPTPLMCQMHIRQDHIRGRSFRVNNHISDQRHTCSKCSFSTRFKKQLQRHSLRCHSIPRKFSQSGLSNMEEAISGKNNIISPDLHAEVLKGCENGQYVMQTFQIKQCNDNGVFVTSVVEMPVLEKLHNSASVSFMVTPMDEH